MIKANKPFGFFTALILLIMLLIALILMARFMVYHNQVHGLGILLLKGEIYQVISKENAFISSWQVEEGDEIKKGDLLLLMRNDQNEYEVLAQQPGIVAEITAYGDSMVRRGDTLAVITSTGDVRNDLEVVGFVSSLEGKKLSLGLKAKIIPSIVDENIYGYLKGQVVKVGKLPMSKSAIQSVIKIPQVAKYIRSQIEAEPFLVRINLDKDANHITGYKWSKKGFITPLDSGIITTFDIVYEEIPWLYLLWPSFIKWF